MSNEFARRHTEAMANLHKAFLGMGEAIACSGPAFAALAELAPAEPGDESSPDTSQPYFLDLIRRIDAVT